MLYGIGVDLTEIARIQAAQQKNPHFAEKVLSQAEYQAFVTLTHKRAWEFLAGRFSVKEAYAKAYGTGIGQVELHDVTTLNNAAGKPEIVAHPFDGRALVSISHTDALVMTQVVLESEATR